MDEVKTMKAAEFKFYSSDRIKCSTAKDQRWQP
jgi:hypothetical protein